MVNENHLSSAKGWYYPKLRPGDVDHVRHVDSTTARCLSTTSAMSIRPRPDVCRPRPLYRFDHGQMFVDHVRRHVGESSGLCSWAGCGATFPRRTLLTSHVRSHTGERMVACYHCGRHFASYRKLRDHLRRQVTRGIGRQRYCRQWQDTFPSAMVVPFVFF